MEQMWDIVADVDRYTEFVPWCTGSQTFGHRQGQCKAHMAVGFPPLNEKYTCIVTLARPRLVKVRIFCYDCVVLTYPCFFASGHT